MVAFSAGCARPARMGALHRAGRDARGAGRGQQRLPEHHAALQPAQRRPRHGGRLEGRRLRGGGGARRRPAQARRRPAGVHRQARQCRRGAVLLRRARPAGGRAELPGADRCQARARARPRVRDGEARFRAAPDGDRARGQDHDRHPRRLPRQPADAQSGPLDGNPLGRHRPRPGAGLDRPRHLHRLLDAAGQRRPRRPGAQLALHGGAGQAHGNQGAQPAGDHDRGAQGGGGGHGRRTGALGPFGPDRRLLLSRRVPPRLRRGRSHRLRPAPPPTSPPCRSACASSRRRRSGAKLRRPPSRRPRRDRCRR